MQNWPRPLDFSILFHPFDAVKLKGARCIWLNDAFCDEDSEDIHISEARQIFTDTFAYIVPGGITFDGFELDQADKKPMQAERYGGFGIGSNGGGARCGSLGPFQVKGCGKNVLAGPDQDVHHSYGGLKAVYAIHEAIYAAILERLLPLGVARILGVILTGPTGAYVRSDVERGWGALLVRDAVLRPANFLRARAFRPTKDTGRILLSDVGRVRRANRELFRLLECPAGFDSYIKRFLRNCANQFVFSRLARLSHGAVTASNIAIDGRWLDLTNTTFSCSSINTGGDNLVSPTFYEELYAPVSIAHELIDTFAKYNGLTIASDWVRTFYQRQVSMYLMLHLPYLFGQPPHGIGNSAPVPAPRLTATVMRIMSSAPTVHRRWPRTLPANDPMLTLIESLLLSTAGCQDSRRALIEQLNANASEVDQLLSELTSVLRKCYGEQSAANDWTDFLRQSFVRAIRQACLTEYFFKQRLGVAIDERLNRGDIGGTETFMTSSVRLARWAFSAQEPGSTVFSSTMCDIRLLNNDSRLLLRTADGEIRGGTADIRAALDTLPATILYIEGFSCTTYLSRVLRGLAVFENANSTCESAQAGQEAPDVNFDFS